MPTHQGQLIGYTRMPDIGTEDIKVIDFEVDFIKGKMK